MGIIFAYGTLMRGYSNHHFMKDSVFMGRGRTVDRHALFDAEFPTVNSTLARSRICGELYLVQSVEAMRKIDELEEHPDVYIRTPCRVELDSGGAVVDCEIYFCDTVDDDTPGVRFLPSGDYRDEKKPSAVSSS